MIATTAQGWGRQKPPLGTPINPGHRLAPYLQAHWMLNEGAGTHIYEATGRYTLSTAGYPCYWRNDGESPTLQMVGYSVLGAAPFPDPGESTLLMNALIYGGASALGPYIGDSGSNGYGFYIGTSGSASSDVGIIAGGSAYNILSSHGTMPLGQMCQMVITRSAPNSTFSLFIDGTLVGSVNLYTATPASVVTMAGAFTGASLYVRDAAIFSKPLSPSDIRSLKYDPFQMFAPPAPWRFYSLPGGAITLYADFSAARLGGLGAGASLVSVADTSPAKAAGRPLGGDILAVGDASAARSAGRPSGPDALRLLDPSTATAAGRASGPEALRLADASAIRAAAKTAGADGLGLSDASAARSGGRGAGGDTLLLFDVSPARLGASALGFDTVQAQGAFVDASTARLALRAAALTSLAVSDASAARGAARALGADRLALSDTGTARGAARAPGTDGLALSDAGAARLGIRAAGADALRTLSQALVRVGGAARGADSLALADAALARIAARCGGLDGVVIAGVSHPRVKGPTRVLFAHGGRTGAVLLSSGRTRVVFDG